MSRRGRWSYTPLPTPSQARSSFCPLKWRPRAHFASLLAWTIYTFSFWSRASCILAEVVLCSCEPSGTDAKSVCNDFQVRATSVTWGSLCSLATWSRAASRNGSPSSDAMTLYVRVKVSNWVANLVVLPSKIWINRVVLFSREKLWKSSQGRRC